jgi:hypothetical protein
MVPGKQEVPYVTKVTVVGWVADGESPVLQWPWAARADVAADQVVCGPFID